jgi:hypothetical protein
MTIAAVFPAAWRTAISAVCCCAVVFLNLVVFGSLRLHRNQLRRTLGDADKQIRVHPRLFRFWLRPGRAVSSAAPSRGIVSDHPPHLGRYISLRGPRDLRRVTRNEPHRKARFTPYRAEPGRDVGQPAASRIFSVAGNKIAPHERLSRWTVVRTNPRRSLSRDSHSGRAQCRLLPCKGTCFRGAKADDCAMLILRQSG